MQLLVHPATPRGPIRTFDVMAVRQGNATLHLIYRLDADLSQLRLPASVTPGRADDLWRHTCFEAFIAAAGSTAYFELNFSPSGQWAAYAFSGCRIGMTTLNFSTEPAVTWRRAEGHLELDVEIRLDALFTDPATIDLRLALAAVVEEQSGTISYWALRHPEKQPDFHHRGGFVLELPGPDPGNDRGTSRS